MIVLDTNVLSELMRHKPDKSVVAWLDAQAAQSIWVTSISVFEARLGLSLLPNGKRRQALESAFAELLAEDLGNRILPFDTRAAEQAATLAASRQRRGRPADVRDTQIAGIVLARRAVLATRNVKHFEDLGSRIVNPWI
jgi:predicted nucleic acid-binding protein